MTRTDHRAPLTIGLRLLTAWREHNNPWFIREELCHLTGRSWRVVNRAVNVLHRRGYIQHSGNGQYRMTPAAEQLLDTTLETHP